MRRTNEKERLRNLESRLRDKGTYREILLNENYSERGFNGEYDALGIRKSGVFVYYEEKASYNEKSYARALRQFQRAKQAYPSRRWRFVYYTPQYTTLVTV